MDNERKALVREGGGKGAMRVGWRRLNKNEAEEQGEV